MNSPTAASKIKNEKKRRPTADASQCARLGQIIRKYRLSAHMGQGELAEKLGLSKTAVGNWELGLTRPDIGTVPRLCAVLGIPVSELLNMRADDVLSREDKTFLDTLHLLDAYDRNTVFLLMERLRRQQDARENARLRNAYSPLCLYENAAAAGVGIPMEDLAENKTVYVLSSHIPPGTDALIRVNGRSMEPVFPDGSCVYVTAAAEVLPGQDGIFIVNGESYIKTYRPDGLYSFNPEYPPILFNDGAEIRAFGRVNGPASRQDIATGSLEDKIRAAYNCPEEERDHV